MRRRIASASKPSGQPAGGGRPETVRTVKPSAEARRHLCFRALWADSRLSRTGAPDRSSRHSRSVLQSVCADGEGRRGSGLFWASGKKSPGARLSVEGQMSFCIKGNFVRTLPPLDLLYFLFAIGLAAPPAVAGAPKAHWSLCLSCRSSPLSGCRFHSACAAFLLSCCRIAAERVASG